MAESQKAEASTASSSTEQILTDDSFAFLLKSGFPVLLARAIEMVAVFSSLMFQTRNIAGYSHRDAIDFFVLYQIYAIYLPTAFQIVLQMRFSVAHVNRDHESQQGIMRNYMLIVCIFSILLAVTAYPFVLLFRQYFFFSDRLLPSLFYFTFCQFPLSALSTALSAKYLVEGRHLLLLGSKSAVFGAWGLLESFIYMFSTAPKAHANNVISVSCCGVAHLVVVVWLWMWNNGAQMLNAVNYSRNAFAFKEIYARTKNCGRTKEVARYIAEAVFLLLQYLSSTIVLLLILREVYDYEHADELDLQVLNYFVYCDVFRLITQTHSYLVSLVYTVAIEKKKYKKALELCNRTLFLMLVVGVLLFLATYFAHFQLFFASNDAAYSNFVKTAGYTESTLYSYLLTSLSVLVETSYNFIIHDRAIFTLIAIVVSKLAVGIAALKQMTKYYGQDSQIMLVFAFSEGMGIVGHSTEVVYKMIQLQLLAQQQQKQERAKRRK